MRRTVAALLVAIVVNCGPTFAQFPQFVQDAFRASDGTTYQVLRALPPLDVAHGGERVRVTTLAGGSTGGFCFLDSTFPNNPMSAISGVLPPDKLRPITDVQRTRVIPLTGTSLVFDASGAGRVTFGTGTGVQNVCRNSADCSGQLNVRNIFPLNSSIGGIAAACVANDIGADCETPLLRQVFGFGLPATSDVCDPPALVTANTMRCDPEPADGFSLPEGHAVVFVYGAPCDTGFRVSAAGFLISGNGPNTQSCNANEVVGATGVASIVAAPPACVPGPLCNAAPRIGCSDSGKSLLLLDAHKRKLGWQWDEGAATDLSAFGDPVSGSTDYAFCLYQRLPMSSITALAMQVEVPAGGTCGTSACWKPLSGGNGFLYKDGSATTDGVKSLFLAAGAAGLAKIVLKGEGTALPVPPPASPMHLLPVNTITGQLVNRLGNCWESNYLLPPGVSTVERFKDKY